MKQSFNPEYVCPSNTIFAIISHAYLGSRQCSKRYKKGRFFGEEGGRQGRRGGEGLSRRTRRKIMRRRAKVVTTYSTLCTSCGESSRVLKKHRSFNNSMQSITTLAQSTFERKNKGPKRMNVSGSGKILLVMYCRQKKQIDQPYGSNVCDKSALKRHT